MKFLIPLIIAIFVAPVFAQDDCRIDVIPKPNGITCGEGSFTFSPKTKVVAGDKGARRSAAVLNDLLKRNFGFSLNTSKPSKTPSRNSVRFNTSSTDLKDEAYSLKVTMDGVEISGSETGQFFAIQTLMQMLPLDFKGSASIRAVAISDKPRFKYRGMHLDVGRHFFPVSFVKKYIDLMSQYKFNYFHWHLTEDQGWRIEIKKYPRLTEVGSKRPETVVGRVLNPYRGDGVPVEGYYTQEQIRDIVAYAKARKITVVPEIDLPGHSSAALAAYPQFGCKPDYQYKVQTTWGIFKEVFCPTEETFRFLNDVLDEVVALFPDSPYIHIGGDEVLKDHWKESAYVQELMKRENLKDEHEVQSYFIRRLGRHVESRGKRFIGWDEILEGGLAPGAIVMSWRGERGGIAAAKAGHEVIMTPSNNLYFDYGQGDTEYEPVNIGNHLPWELVYNYDPVPKDLTAEEARFVLGAQGNVWTEYMKTPEKVEFMAFPRALALSEVVWTEKVGKDVIEFGKRLRSHYDRLDRRNVSYRIPRPVGLMNYLTRDGDGMTLRLESPINGGSVFYTTDGSVPSTASKRYAEPEFISLEPGQMKEINAIVVNSKGRASSVHTAVFYRGVIPEGRTLDAPKAGVTVAFYDRLLGDLSLMENSPPNETRESSSIQLPQFASRTDSFKKPFGASMTGWLCVPANNVYAFQIESDGPARLTVAGKRVIDFAGGQRYVEPVYGKAVLGAGCHETRLSYMHRSGEAVLNLRWGPKGTGLRRIFGSELFR